MNSQAMWSSTHRNPRHEAVRVSGPTLESLLNLLTFLSPAVLFLDLRIVGQIYATELLLLAIAPLAFATKMRSGGRTLPTLLVVLGCLWLLSQVITDVVRVTSFEDYSRGWAKIGITLTSMAVLYMLMADNRARVLLFAFGLSIGLLLRFYISPTALVEADAWKFGLAEPITIALILVACMLLPHRQSLAILIVGLIAVLNLLEGTRSLFGIAALTTLYLLAATYLFRETGVAAKFTLGKCVMVGAICAVAAVAALAAYSYAASSGILGEPAREKYEAQTQGRFGLIIGGRSELLVSLQAIQDSPILGHGSWAEDYRYVNLLIHELEQMGYPLRVLTSDKIPSHSHLFGVWVEGGVMGALFWLAVLGLPVLVLMRMIHVRSALAPLIVLTAVWLIWDIMFSPFAGERRVMTPFFIVVQLYALSILQSPPDESLERTSLQGIR